MRLRSVPYEMVKWDSQHLVSAQLFSDKENLNHLDCTIKRTCKTNWGKLSPCKTKGKCWFSCNKIQTSKGRRPLPLTTSQSAEETFTEQEVQVQ